MCNWGLKIKCNQCDKKSKDKKKYLFQTINVVWDKKLKKKTNKQTNTKKKKKNFVIFQSAAAKEN